MLQMNFVSNTRKTTHTNDVTRNYVIINRIKYVYNFWMSVFSIFIFCSAITCWDVSHDYLPEMFAILEEQRNNFEFDKEKEKYI